MLGLDGFPPLGATGKALRFCVAPTERAKSSRLKPAVLRSAAYFSLSAWRTSSSTAGGFSKRLRAAWTALTAAESE
jgi:hypothetical protein